MFYEYGADWPQTSFKNYIHMLQMGYSNSFQDFISTSGDWTGSQTSTEFDLTTIATMPISIYTIVDDVLCPEERTDIWSADLATLQNYKSIPLGEDDTAVGHDYFLYTDDDTLLDSLLAEIGADPIEGTAEKVTLGAFESIRAVTATIAAVSAACSMFF